jgi:hypothetical protein
VPARCSVGPDADRGIGGLLQGRLRPLPLVPYLPCQKCPRQGSALSTWLNAGVDPTEVAERADNSVEILLTRYAKCLDGRQDVADRCIEDLLREYE